MNEKIKTNILKDNHGDLNELGYTVIGILMITTLIIIIALVMIIIPKYTVWTKTLKGEAMLREAEYSKKIQVEEAKANLEAEKLNAKAEVERAKGMAKAMNVEGGKLTDTYIKYLWVKNMNNSKNTKIYIPTEAGIPILEKDNNNEK